MKNLIVALAALTMMGVSAFADGTAPTATQPATAAQPASAVSSAKKGEKRMAKKSVKRHARFLKHKKFLKKVSKKEANKAS